MLSSRYKLSMSLFKRILFILPLSIIMVLFQNCGGFNSSDLSAIGDANNPETIALGKGLFEQNCAACHSSFESTNLTGRSSDQIRNAIRDFPQMNVIFSNFSNENINAISVALIDKANGGGETEIGDSGRLQFACTPGSISKTPLLKLNNREFKTTLNFLLDTFSSNLKNDADLNSLYDLLPYDSIQSESSIKEQSQLTTQLQTIAYFDVSFKAGELVAQSNNLDSYIDGSTCLSENSLSQDCHRQFVAKLSSQAFRRPVLENEVNSISNQFWDNSLNKEDQLILTFTGIVQKPDFLYKIFNRGNSLTSALNTTLLTNFELANKLSYLLTGGPPDQTLYDLATSGQISNEAILSQQVDRLLDLPEASATIIRFFRESYGYDVYDDFIYSYAYANQDNISVNQLKANINDELDDFFAHLVLNLDVNFSDLFTSRYANLGNINLARVYGVSSTGVVTLPVERSGFLNRAAMLTKRSGLRASPIKRGLHVLEKVLCGEVGAPPPSAPTSLPETVNVATTRVHTENISQVPGTSCNTCHSRFNPLGFAFESFDSLGRFRTMEDIYDDSGDLVESLPVDTVMSTLELGSREVSANDSVELSREIASSDKAMLCFVKHLKEFESRIAPDQSSHCQMNESLYELQDSSKSSGTLTGAIKKLILSDEFRYWSY